MIAVSAAAAGAVAATAFSPSGPAATPDSADDRQATVSDRSFDRSFDQTAPVAERLAALEDALIVERQARQVLEEELLVLTDQLDALGEAANLSASSEQESLAQVAAQGEATPRRSRRRGLSDEERRDRLVDAGFSLIEADRIMRRESEIRMAAIQARYDAQRSGEAFDGRNLMGSLREELGDPQYERYLEASGRPTSVTLSTIYEGSPALTAGFLPGDQITHYDGRRVFGMNEISELTLTGNAGEMVAVDILRGGVPMQLTVPRGPLGVVGGRRFRR